MAFSHVFHSTGFLTQRFVSATIHLLSSASNIATSVPFKMRGDLANSFKIPNQQQQAINAYNSSLTSLNNAIEKGWHKAEKVNPDDPVLSGWQSWEVNDITGDKRINGLVQAITPVYPEAAAIPFPKLGKLFSWLRSIKFGAGAAKGGSSWVYGAFKTEAKWAGQLSKRGWTVEQITEAVTKGKTFDAVNMVNKANSATRYVHPTTGQSVVIDNVTKELLHVGGPGFKY